MRTISILLSKSKYQRSGDNCNLIIHALVEHLCRFGLMKHIYVEHMRPKLASSSSGDSSSLASSGGGGGIGGGGSSAETPVGILGRPPAHALAGGVISYTHELRFHDELAPYFVRFEEQQQAQSQQQQQQAANNANNAYNANNKDSFVVPPPNLLTPPTPLTTTTTTTTTGATATAKTTASSTATSTIELFDNYTELFVELLIRLPYQICDRANGQHSFLLLLLQHTNEHKQHHHKHEQQHRLSAQSERHHGRLQLLGVDALPLRVLARAPVPLSQAAHQKATSDSMRIKSNQQHFLEVDNGTF